MVAIPQVRDYMSMRVVSVDDSDSVYNAADIIVKNNIGCVVVTRYGDVVGIVTKGDILRNALLKSRDPVETKIRDVMTKSPILVEASSSLEQAAKVMTEKNVTKLPVLDEGILVGVISASDIIRAEPTYASYLRSLIERKTSMAY
jgi:CBS domain-containing protein